MTIDLTPTILKAVEIILVGGIGFISGYYIQKLRNRPEITTHGCRILDKQVYTYFQSDNNPSKPACSYLSKEGNCQFVPDNEEKKRILKNQGGKCYIAKWNQ